MNTTQTGSEVGSALIPSAENRPGNDPIFALNGEARARTAAGEHILNATLGTLLHEDRSIAVLPTVLEALRSALGTGPSGYAPISGTPAFLEAVIKDAVGTRWKESAVAVSTAGGTGAIHHTFLNFVPRGGSVLLPSYYWGPYRVIADHAGRSVRTFPMFDSHLAFNVEALEAGIHAEIDAQGRVLVVLNFPCHNPTGYALDADEWQVVAGILARAGQRAPVSVLIDYAYARYADSESDRWRDALPTLMESTTVLLAWTASKSFTQYGARVGALLALHSDPAERERLANALNYSCRATWSNCNHLGMSAVSRLLTDPELAAQVTLERNVLSTLLADRVSAFKEHADHAGLRYPRYDSGFFVTVLTDDSELAAARMRDEGVFVVPIEGGLRVALCATPIAEVPRLTDALAAGVSAAS